MNEGCLAGRHPAGSPVGDITSCTSFAGTLRKGIQKILKRINSARRYAYDNVVHLKFQKLGQSSLRIVEYSDASFDNNHDLTSQLGRITLIMDDSNAAIPIYFKSYKSLRVKIHIICRCRCFFRLVR